MPVANEASHMVSRGSPEWHAGLLRAWHLALRRLALTHDNADRLGVLAVAREMDRLGRQREDRPGFSFFQRKSTELAAAMLRHQADDEVILEQYAAQIGDARLQRAFEAALEVPQRRPEPARKRLGPDRDLWRGLPSRGVVRP